MVFTPAKPVISSQTGPHHNLEKTVCRHLETKFQKPVNDYTRKAFDVAYSDWQSAGKPQLILDSACGTAESSRHFAKNNPDKLCIGIDQSEHRLNKSDNKNVPENLILLRCDCTDFWRLADQAKWQFDRHYLLYPNPYPKTEHLQRRWHGHPAFPSLIAMSKHLELRTNWQIYAEEFYTALKQVKVVSKQEPYSPENSITAFERKYLQSGHTLWKVETLQKT